MTRLTGKGSALLKIRVSGPGKLVVFGKGVRRLTKSPQAAGSTSVAIRAKGAKLRTLRERGKVTVTVKISFTPRDGTGGTVTRKVTLVKK